MSAPAAFPALALLLGAALGLSTGRPPLVFGAGVVCVAWLVALVAFCRARPPIFLACVALSYLASGWALAAIADETARHPPLLGAWRAARAEGPLELEGRLRGDAMPSAGGAGLSVAVQSAAAGGVRRSAPGGVRLTVSGQWSQGRVGEWRDGRRVRLPAQLHEATRNRNPGVPDARLALARRGTILVGSTKSAALVETLAPGRAHEEAAAALRHRTRQVVARHVGRWSARSAAIVVAIIIGDRAGLDDEVERRLQEAGTYHVIAISGGNIAILAGLVLALLRGLRAGHRGSSAVAIVVLTGYACVVGGGPSVVRATLMAVIYLAARLGDHRGSPINALCTAGALAVAAAPLTCLDVGFALTFGATLGILAGLSLARTALPRAPWLEWPAALLLASVCAEVALFPVAARAFARVTFAGLVLNFAAIPLMTLVQVGGMLVLPLAAASPAAASAAGWAAHVGAEGLVRSSALVDLVPWLSYRLPPPHVLALVVYYGAWASWFLPRSGAGRGAGPRFTRWGRRLALAVIVVSGAWILVEPVTLLAPGVSGRLRLAVLDVGHADAILVQLPDRRSVLVDAGGSLTGSSFDIGGRVVAPALWALGTRRLDVLVLSHGDPDHVGGAEAIIRDFCPKEVWEGVPVPPLERLQALRAQAERSGARWRTCRAGDRLELGEVRVAIWHPPPPDWERQRVRNDDSLVIELRYGDVSIVLPGDIGRPVEQGLAARVLPAPLRVLKVPHHGSISSSSGEFLAALKPDVAVLSAGPSTKVSDVVLARYRDAGAALFRTDLDGAVIVTTRGRSLEVETFTGRTASVTTGSTTKDTKITKGRG